MFIASSAVLTFAQNRSISDNTIFNVANIVQNISLILGYWLFSKKRGWRSLGERFFPVTHGVVFLSIICAIVLSLLWGVQLIALARLGGQFVLLPIDGVMPGDLGQLPLGVLAMVIIGPFAEELFFRGLLLDWLQSKIAPWAAILVVSALFALLHNNGLSSGILGWMALAYRFLMGVAAAALTLRYKSLRAPLILHGTCNSVACVSSALLRFF